MKISIKDVLQGYHEIREVIIIYLLKLFLVSILPGLLWVWYFYRQDRYDPEPKSLILRDFIWGMIIVLPASLLESPFGAFLSAQTPLLMLLLGTIFVVGLIEEGLKSYVVYRLHFDHPEFDEPVDGIIYGIIVGLGFAAFENLVYTVIYGYQVGLVRAVLTSLAHASFTGIFGYYLSRAKIMADSSLIVRGIILVSLLHGIYDFLVIGGFMGLITIVIVIAILQIYLASLIKGASEKSPFK